MFFADICSLGVLREQILRNIVSPNKRGLLHKQYRLDMHNILMYIFKKRRLIYYLMVVPICLEDVYHNYTVKRHRVGPELPGLGNAYQ